MKGSIRRSAGFTTVELMISVAIVGILASIAINAFRDYTRRARIDWTLVPFDIVNVILGHPPQVEWIPDAFSTNAVPLNRGPRSSSRP